MIYPHYPGKPNRGFFLGASPRTHEKVKVKSNMPALHWSSPGSGGPSTVVLFVFFWRPPSKKKIDRASRFCIFFWLPGLKQGTAEAILIPICRIKKNSQNMHLVIILWPPLQTSIFDLFRENCWIKIPLEKFNWMRVCGVQVGGQALNRPQQGRCWKRKDCCISNQA